MFTLNGYYKCSSFSTKEESITHENIVCVTVKGKVFKVTMDVDIHIHEVTKKGWKEVVGSLNSSLPKSSILPYELIRLVMKRVLA